MASTITRAPSAVAALIADRIASGHYPELVEAEVTVSAWFAYPKGDGPALTLHGDPCAAIIKKNNARDRLEGKADASLTIDAEGWEDRWTAAQKVALIDHELFHLIVARTKPTKKDPVSRIKSDDAGRPVLKMRAHDIVIGGFAEIARRHGGASFEVMVAREIKNAYGQLLFAWGDDNAPADDMPDMRLGEIDEEAA